MFTKCVLSLALLVGLSLSAGAQQPQAAPGSGLNRVTLYGPLARGYDASRAFVSFKTGAHGPDWDLGYGSLYVSGERDWLQVSNVNDARTAFRDLGALGWTDTFTVPVVEPFPKLKEGGQRLVVVNADAPPTPARPTGPKSLAGPDPSGVDNLAGATGSLGNIPPNPIGDTPGPMSSTYVEPSLLSRRPRQSPPAPPAPPRPATPPSTPIFVKAVVGHIYAVHVVDGAEDFYVLFRVESLVRGDNCTITWKRVAAPRAGSADKN